VRPRRFFFGVLRRAPTGTLGLAAEPGVCGTATGGIKSKRGAMIVQPGTGEQHAQTERTQRNLRPSISNDAQIQP
jgi:hypothetical protein